MYYKQVENEQTKMDIISIIFYYVQGLSCTLLKYLPTREKIKNLNAISPNNLWQFETTFFIKQCILYIDKFVVH